MYASLLVKSKKVAENIPESGMWQPGECFDDSADYINKAGSFAHFLKENLQRTNFLQSTRRYIHI